MKGRIYLDPNCPRTFRQPVDQSTGKASEELFREMQALELATYDSDARENGADQRYRDFMTLHSFIDVPYVAKLELIVGRMAAMRGYGAEGERVSDVPAYTMHPDTWAERWQDKAGEFEVVDLRETRPS